MTRLYHVSEEPGIRRFEPRPSPRLEAPGVWAVAGPRLHNYLLPRDCPRVTCFWSPRADEARLKRILPDAKALVAIERGWLERVRACRLYLYGMPGDVFGEIDPVAGYAVSPVPVVPVGCEAIEDLAASIRDRGVEFRTVDRLWPLRDAVMDATPDFSFIRMRNAQPRL